MDSSKDSENLIATAGRMADAAAVETLRYFRQQGAMETEDKGEGEFDPVTLADRAAEKAMREVLAEDRPDDGVLGEEFGHSAGSSGYTWVLDPIDGTRSFISGTPVWGTLIAVNQGGAPLLGIVDQPFTGERFIGGLGRAEWSRGTDRRELRVRECPSLATATLFTTLPEVGTPDERTAFERVAGEVQLTRYGTDCYAYALLALGQIDLVIEAGLNAYDIQGPIAVIEAAGGVVTDWEGQPAHGGGQVIAAGDRAVHAAALELLQK